MKCETDVKGTHHNFRNILANSVESFESSYDPPVEKIPKVQEADVIEIINFMKESFRRGDLEDVRDKIRILSDQFSNNRKVQLFGDGFLKEVCQKTDLVQFILQLAGQKDDLDTAFMAAKLTAALLSNSNFAIHESLDQGAFELFKQLLGHPLQAVQKYGFWIVAYLNRTEKGARMCYSTGILESMCSCFRYFISETPEAEILHAISQGFRYFGEFAHKFPRSARMEILSCYFVALGRDIQFAADALAFCWSVVSKLKDQGVADVFDSLIMTHLMRLTQTCESKLILYLCEVLCQMLHVQNAEIRRGLVKQIDAHSFIRIFLETTDRELFRSAVRVLISISSVSKEFDWFFTEQVQAKAMNYLDNGTFQEKEILVDIVFLVMGLGTHNDIENLLSTDLPIMALDLLQTSTRDVKIRSLKAVHHALDQITRFGVDTEDRFIKFEDKLIDILKEESVSSDETVQRLATRIFESNFPEAFYGTS